MKFLPNKLCLLRLLFFVNIIFLLQINSIYANEAYPNLTEIVTDSAGIFSEDEVQKLRKKLSDFEIETSNQVVVLTIKSLSGESIESYALETFNQNKLGQKDKDNGVLILFAKEDRKVRIEVGYGLEGVLTDILSGRIIQDRMIPEFKSGNYFTGIENGTDDIIKFLKQPELGESFLKEKQISSNTSNNIPSISFIVIFGAAILGFIIIVLRFLLPELISNYLMLIEAHSGLLTGKIGLIFFPFLLFALLFLFFGTMILLILPFGFGLILLNISTNSNLQIFDKLSFIMDYFPIILITVLLIIPFIIAFYKVLSKKDLVFKLSLLKNDEKYVDSNFPSGGSGGSGSSGGSRSSSSGFSGGSGSSGGGGSSGSW